MVVNNIKLIIMTTIDLNEKVKEKLIEYKEENGCKTYSDAVNLLLKGSEK